MGSCISKPPSSPVQGPDPSNTESVSSQSTLESKNEKSDEAKKPINLNPFVVIDFGSTNSVAILCKLHESGKLESIRLGDDRVQGLNIFPSVVAYTDEKVFVGCNAEKKLKKSRNQNIRFVKFVKRIIGLTYEEYLNLENRDIFGCEVFERDGKPYFRIHENDEMGKSGEEVASEIFKMIKEVADRRNEESVTDCYVTVPANYNDRQREAIINAATLAGFNVEGIFHEPTAAAMNWCLTDLSKKTTVNPNEKILVFDFGGGTLDISIINYVNDIKYDVLCVGGNVRLGGSDIDAAIAKFFIEKYSDIIPASIQPGGKKYGEFLSLCEEAKIETSMDKYSFKSISRFVNRGRQSVRISSTTTTENGSTTTTESAIAGDDDDDDDDKYSFDLTQEILGEIIRREFKSVINKSIDDVIHQTKYECGNIKHVFMVGGSSNLREVKELVKQRFIMATFHEIDAMSSVAQGATAMAQYIRLGIAPWKDIVNYSYGLLVPGEKIVIMIHRGSPLPSYGKPQGYQTTTEHPDIIFSSIYQIEDESVDSRMEQNCIPYNPRTCVKIKEYTFKNTNPHPEGKERFKITFKIEAGGTLEVLCHDENGNELINRQSYKNLLA